MNLSRRLKGFAPQLGGSLRRWWSGAPETLPADIRPPSPGPTLCWGGEHLDRRWLAPHTSITGTTRSGKTWTLLMLMRSALLNETGRLRARTCVYDAQDELLAAIEELGVPREKIFDFNPFHEDSVGWDMAADIVEPAQAHHIAQVLFADEGRGRDNAFFINASRGLCAGVLLAFLAAGNTKWELFHLIYALSDKEILRRLLESTPEAAHMVAQFLEAGRTFRDIQATLANEVLRYRVIANLWRRCSRKISLDQWAKSPEPSVLVLSTREVAKTAQLTLNRLIFKRLVEVLLDRKKKAQHEAWVFLDELADAGRLDGLYSLLTRGASKNCRAVLAFQEVRGLREAYGDNAAASILSQCGNRAAFRITDYETADWLAKHFGKYQYWQTSYTEGESENEKRQIQRSSSTQWGLQERDYVPHYELFNYPLADPERGLHGVFTCPGASMPWEARIPADVVLRESGRRSGGAEPETKLRDFADQWTPELNETDRSILLLDGAAAGRRHRRTAGGIRFPGEAKARKRLEDFFGEDDDEA